MILIGSENSKTSQQLSDTLNKTLVQEFKDYI